MKKGATTPDEGMYKVESDRPPPGDEAYDAATRVGPQSYQALAKLLKDKGELSFEPKPAVEEPGPTSRTQFVEAKRAVDDEPPIEATKLMPQAPAHPTAEAPLPVIPVAPQALAASAPRPALPARSAPPPQPMSAPIPIPQVPEASWANPDLQAGRPRYGMEVLIGAIVFIVLCAPVVIWVLLRD